HQQEREHQPSAHRHPPAVMVTPDALSWRARQHSAMDPQTDLGLRPPRRAHADTRLRARKQWRRSRRVGGGTIGKMKTSSERRLADAKVHKIPTPLAVVLGERAP